MIGRPKIRFNECITEIAKRTGIPFEVCNQVLLAYEDIICQALKASVEVMLFKHLGVVTWKVVPPKPKRRIYNFQKRDYVESEGTDGYHRTTFRFSRKWAYELRDATRIPYVEVENVDNGTEEDRESSNG